MPKIIKARRGKKYKPPIGDILYGGEFYEKLNVKRHEGARAIRLGCLGMNTWVVLALCGIDGLEKLVRAVTYECPYTEHQYFWSMPIALCGDIDQYIQELKKSDHLCFIDYACDTSFHCQDGQVSITDWEMSRVTELWMGSGYTIGTLATDGSIGKVRVQVPLDNGDWILVESWEWYNK